MSKRDQQLAVERLLRPHFDRLYRLAFRLTGNRADAEDLFQDVLIRAFEKIDTIVALDNPGTWLGRVMYNRFVDGSRKRARQRLVVVSDGEMSGDGLEGLPGSGSAESDAGRLEQQKVLSQALGSLSEEHRIVVLLHDTEGYKIKEIEELTGIPAGTVKSRLHRARARLREILFENGTKTAS